MSKALDPSTAPLVACKLCTESRICCRRENFVERSKSSQWLSEISMKLPVCLNLKAPLRGTKAPMNFHEEPWTHVYDNMEIL